MALRCLLTLNFAGIAAKRRDTDGTVCNFLLRHDEINNG